MLKITGYSNKFSSRPGEELRFYVHSSDSKDYQADIVRLIHGDTNPAGPGFKEELIETTVSGTYKGREQGLFNGSYLLVQNSDKKHFRSLSFGTLVYATTPEQGQQSIFSKSIEGTDGGFDLCINENGILQLKLYLESETQVITTQKPLVGKIWYFIGVSFDASTGTAQLMQEPCITSSNSGHGPRILSKENYKTQIIKTSFPPQELRNSEAYILIAAKTKVADTGRILEGAHYSNLTKQIAIPEHTSKFNGKIEHPIIAEEVIDLDEIKEICLQKKCPQINHNFFAILDFSKNITPTAASCDVIDISGSNNNGVLVNMPCRGVTGYAWQDSMSYKDSPDQFGAIHFHDDDIDDARWEIDFSFVIPKDLKSGCYAARLRVNGKSDLQNEDYIPFFVRPAPSQRPAPIALIIPTASYMAYANDNLNMESPIAQLITGRVTALQPSDLLFNELHNMGYGLYGTHTDGSGISISSRLRPILNMRPKYQHFLSPSVRQYNADLHLVDWLTEKKYDFDIHTDEDVHLEGSDLLNRYKVILTGSHPEYQTESCLNAYEDYQDQGGRMLYLGGNGFYWVTNYHPQNTNIIEVRRGDNATRAWTISPGEYCGMFDGKHGGIWRVRGRNMAKLVGVSFSAFGLDVCSYYRRSPDSQLHQCKWIFDGIDDDIIGDFGLVGGGAAGFEIDRYDLSLGTPENSFLLASSEGHTDMYMCVTEEVSFNFRGYFGSGGGGDQNPLIRADMVYFKTPNDGATFSVGSISYCGSLSHNSYDNNISRLTQNVIDGFLEDGPLP
tara:strand:+ start:1482 stop:3836 length:2355 start_codon:yes stop_codon:yes gene_type:complete